MKIMILVIPISVVLISSLLLALKYKIAAMIDEKESIDMDKKTAQRRTKNTHIVEINNIDRTEIPLSIY